MVTKNYH